MSLNQNSRRWEIYEKKYKNEYIIIYTADKNKTFTSPKNYWKECTTLWGRRRRRGKLVIHNCFPAIRLIGHREEGDVRFREHYKINNVSMDVVLTQNGRLHT